MSKRLYALKLSIAILSLIGFFESGKLALQELSTGDVCIKWGTVPVCYIVVIFAFLLVISQFRFSNSSKMVFWIGLMVPWSIALVTGIMQLNALVPCPSYRFGIPICYWGFLLFSLIMLLNRVKKNLFPQDGVVFYNLFGSKY